ncbi:MAG: dihydrodipicolinate synthase family protein, partial [Terrimicrobiaceae bacterium]
MRPTAALQGIFVPNIVPYHKDGTIHEEELRRIIRWIGGKGVTGFYPNGSMGEFIRLSYEERKRVVTIVTEEAAG